MSYLGWRWVYWLTMIYAATMLVLAALFLPETYASSLLAKRARKIRKAQDAGDSTVYFAAQERQDFSPKILLSTHLLRPFIMLVKEPILLLVTIYLSVVYGLLYATFSMFPVIWGQLRGFNLGESGLIFLGVGIGTSKCIQ
jgi:DHA1 family multidrug resistance protein-like MFS transporter